MKSYKRPVSAITGFPVKPEWAKEHPETTFIQTVQMNEDDDGDLLDAIFEIAAEALAGVDESAPGVAELALIRIKMMIAEEPED